MKVYEVKGGGGHTAPKSGKENPVDIFKYTISPRHRC